MGILFLIRSRCSHFVYLRATAGAYVSMEIAGTRHHERTPTNGSDVERITRRVLGKPDTTKPDPMHKEILQPTKEPNQTSIPTPVNTLKLAKQGYDASKINFLMDTTTFN